MTHAPLDLALLRAFVTVVEAGSFSAAAPRLGRSQSAVSMQIQRLEQSIGKPLLVRGSKAVTPNAAGADFLVHARRLLKLSDELWSKMTRPEEVGTVRLGLPDDYAAFLLPPVLAQFASEHPLVSVEVVCEPSTSLNRLLASNRIDLAIVTRLFDQPVEVLKRVPMVWVASPSHMPWEEYPLPVALFEQGCAARATVVKALAEQERAYRCTYSSASLFGLAAVVQAGLAVAGVALCSVPPGLQIIGEEQGLPSLGELEIALLRNPASSSAAVDCLTSFLRRVLSQAG